MAYVSASPFKIQDAICAQCSNPMRRRPSFEFGVGKILYSCDKCKYTFEGAAEHLVGQMGKYDEPDKIAPQSSGEPHPAKKKA